jgi:hypothetical protein
VVGAQLRVLRDGFSDQILWEGRSGAGGLVKVPAQYEGMPVLVRAPGFAFYADFLPQPTPGEEPWQLEKGPGGRTTLVVVDEESRTIAGAEVAVRVGNVWLRGENLAWLADNTAKGPRTGGDGSMVLRDLPSRKLLVLAKAGSFDPEDFEGLAFHAKILEAAKTPLLIVPATP